ncbi:MAG TPA: hypothetical protein V6D15_11125 [Oculatellaceae cyanobacterium]|jgi:hypothetical protein
MKEYDDWAMYEAEGNLAVAQMMQEIKQALSNNPLPKVRQLLHQKIREVGSQYGEIYDSDVRNTILFRLTRWACEVHELDSKFGRLDCNYWGL